MKKTSETLRDLDENALHVISEDDPDASIFGGRRFFDDGRPLFKPRRSDAYSMLQRLKQWRLRGR